MIRVLAVLKKVYRGFLAYLFVFISLLDLLVAVNGGSYPQTFGLKIPYWNNQPRPATGLVDYDNRVRYTGGIIGGVVLIGLLYLFNSRKGKRR